MMKVATTIALLFALSSSLSGQSNDSLSYISLDPYYFHLEYITTEPSLMIDVRETFEFRGKRIKEAINIPSVRKMEALTDTLDKSYSLFLYCTSGYRSKNAAEYLYKKGFHNLFNLDGGLAAWKKEGMPVVKRKP